ncbi:MAG: molybdenum cofactor biosysynthesis protein [Nibricoccus sp.]
MVRVRHIFISTDHNFFGHHGQPAGTNPTVEVEQVECLAGRGLKGDRFCGFKDDYKGQLTLFSWEVFQQLKTERSLPALSPDVFRRNIIVEGLDLNALVGKRFDLQGVTLEGTVECKPCHWMDEAVGPGAEAWLQGRGGLRCKIVTDGVLHRE